MLVGFPPHSSRISILKKDVDIFDNIHHTPSVNTCDAQFWTFEWSDLQVDRSAGVITSKASETRKGHFREKVTKVISRALHVTLAVVGLPVLAAHRKMDRGACALWSVWTCSLRSQLHISGQKVQLDGNSSIQLERSVKEMHI